MKPLTSGSALLYVSDNGTNDVYALSYPSGDLVGTLTGFGSPQGLCTDASGDIFVTDSKNAAIVEYAHGGSSPIQTLSASGRPDACAVDPTTGNLAVANENSFVSIYPKAKGTPNDYSTQTSAVFDAYDVSGNLYVTEPGELSSGNIVELLPSGGASFERLNLDKRLGNFWPAGVQFHGKDLVVAHSGPSSYGCCGRVYRFILSGTNGRHAGSFLAKTDLVDFFIYGSTILTTTGGSKIDFYNYPKIRQPTQTVDEPGSFSDGVVISEGSSR